MKKEAVSVLKPRNGKQFNGKVKKLAKGKPGKIEKKNSPKKDSSIEPRGGKRLKNVGIENVIGNNLQSSSNIKSKSANGKKITNLPRTNVKKEKKKNVKNDSTTDGKMAAVSNDPEIETRVNPKKQKIRATNELSDAPIKNGKKRKSKIEHADENKKINSEITLKKEKKRKLKLETIEAPTKVEPDVAPKSKKRRKPKIKKINEIENTETEGAESSKKSIDKIAIKALMENSGDLKLTKEHILKSAESILKLSRKELDSKKSLLPTETDPIYLQVICVKIPKTPRRQIRPYLPHPLAGPLDDVALFVPDLELGRKKDYEKTVDHWETIFREKGIDFIKEIIPMNRVKTEYSQFEMRRKLAGSFDYFLADGRICGHLTHLLGRGFYNRRSAPTPVKLLRDNLKEELNFALHKTCMEIHGFGDSHSVQVGNVSMEATKLVDNVWATCETLAEQYPGGWANVRAIRIKTRNGLAIPIYLTLKSKNKITQPVVKPKRPRAYEDVEGELTTLPGSATVTVTPEGRIKLKRERDFDGEDEDEVKEEDDEDEDDEIKEEDDEDENDEIKEEDDEDEQ